MMTFVEQLLLLVATPLYVAIIGIEWGLSLWADDDTYSLSDTATNVYLTALNTVVDLLMAGVTLWFLSWFWLHRTLVFEPSGVAYWLALFVLQDFFYYVLHYVDHHCRLFWAVHVTRRSSEHFNFSTGIRSSVLEPLYRMFFFAPIALLGFQPVDILVMYAGMQIVGILLVHHGRCGKLGPLEWVFVTPSHHRVHHASNPQLLRQEHRHDADRLGQDVRDLRRGGPERAGPLRPDQAGDIHAGRSTSSCTSGRTSGATCARMRGTGASGWLSCSRGPAGSPSGCGLRNLRSPDEARALPSPPWRGRGRLRSVANAGGVG